MVKKQGITVAVMVITVLILGILAGTITYSAYTTINYSKVSAWASEITYIQDVVNEKLRDSSTIVDSGNVIYLNVSRLSQTDINEQFANETITSSNTVELTVLDLSKLNITDTIYGKMNTTNDVYVVSLKTGRVYYVEGIELNGKIYYTLTDGLVNRFDITSKSNNLSSVIFVPSELGFTNTPITVTVKVPKTFTDIVITSSNTSIDIGTQVVKDKTYEYLVNESNIEGNYDITVTYNDGVQTLTSKYNVNGYDTTKPIITPLTEENFVYKKTETTILDYLINVTVHDESGIRIIKYSLGKIEETQAYNYFQNNGNQITDGKINLNRETNEYTIYAEDNAGNFSILTFNREDYISNVPTEWKANVRTIVDEVPIPKGFSASNATGENTREGGLVIYEGTGEVNDTNVVEARKTRNQYVWVPIDKDTFETTFKREDLILSTRIATKLGTSGKYWEVTPDTEENTDNLKYMVKTTTLAEVQAMYASVKEYGGFYIGRYEAGIDAKRDQQSQTGADLPRGLDKVHSKMGKIGYDWIPWTWNEVMDEESNGAVEVARGLYPNNATNTTGIVSTLIYGVQWDSTVAWLKANGKTLDGNKISDVTESITYGNYKNHIIEEGDLNPDALYWDYSQSFQNYFKVTYSDGISTLTKDNNTRYVLSTGALKAASLNNIYDMAGNFFEYTMEGYSTNIRVGRGGMFTVSGSDYSLASRYNYSPSNGAEGLGFRVTLYIKNS